jgi:hypothetical protein
MPCISGQALQFRANLADNDMQFSASLAFQGKPSFHSIFCGTMTCSSGQVSLPSVAAVQGGLASLAVQGKPFTLFFCFAVAILNVIVKPINKSTPGALYSLLVLCAAKSKGIERTVIHILIGVNTIGSFMATNLTRSQSIIIST